MNLCRIVAKNSLELCAMNKMLPSLCSFRNTFIVKRLKNPPVSRYDAERPRILKRRHFVYETVEDTDLIEPPDLKVVLTKFVEGIGDVGDVISVMAVYAREHLLLPRKAEYATPENIKKYTALKKSKTGRPIFSSIHAGMTVRTLSRVVIPVFMNSETSWTLDKNHLYVAFRAEGYHVPEEVIDLPDIHISGPDPKIEGCDFAVHVTINNTEKVAVRCRVFHIKPGMEIAKISDDVYLDKNEPILEEQREVLDKMPIPEILNDPSANISLVEKYRIQYIN